MLAGANVTHLTCCFVRKFIRLMQLLNAENLVVPLIWPLSKRDHGLQHGQYHVLQSFSHLPQYHVCFFKTLHTVCAHSALYGPVRGLCNNSPLENIAVHIVMLAPLCPGTFTVSLFPIIFLPHQCVLPS